MADVYGRRKATFGGAFSADDAIMKFGGLKDENGNPLPAQTPLLLQNASFNYQQNITRLFDISSSNIYYVAGPAAGQGSLAQVLGPTKVSQAFMRSYGSVCNADEHTLNFQMLGGCSNANDLNGSLRFATSHGFIAAYVVLNSVGVQMSAQQMVIQQSLGLTFSSLEYTDNAVT